MTPFEVFVVRGSGMGVVDELDVPSEFAQLLPNFVQGRKKFIDVDPKSLESKPKRVALHVLCHETKVLWSLMKHPIQPRTSPDIVVVAIFSFSNSSSKGLNSSNSQHRLLPASNSS